MKSCPLGQSELEQLPHALHFGKLLPEMEITPFSSTLTMMVAMMLEKLVRLLLQCTAE